MGWFGPRGLASIVLGLIFLEREVQLTYESTIVGAVAATVLFSVFAHGVSALPGINWFAHQVDKLDTSAPESKEAGSVRPG
jgi:NhaP-type Na+/H+ or K+/H+ antiporter